MTSRRLGAMSNDREAQFCGIQHFGVYCCRFKRDQRNPHLLGVTYSSSVELL